MRTYKEQLDALIKTALIHNVGDGFDNIRELIGLIGLNEGIYNPNSFDTIFRHFDRETLQSLSELSLESQKTLIGWTLAAGRMS